MPAVSFVLSSEQNKENEMRFSALTDLGLVRKNNEDSLLARDSEVGPVPNLFIVADGMGGHVGENNNLVPSLYHKVLEQ